MALSSVNLSIAFAALMLFFLGLAIGRVLAAQAAGARVSRLQDEKRSLEVELKNQARMVERQRAEKLAFNNFLFQMSEFAREINTDLDRKKLALLLLRIVDQMFQAKQILIFYTTSEGERLYLAESKGYALPVGRRLEVPWGKGRVGWVAEHKITMDRDDFSNQTRTGEVAFENDPPGLRVDLLAPMVHAERTVGVIGIGGAELQPAEQKKMLKMAADLGSAALHQAHQYQEVQHYANQDGLTRLLNKRHFMIELASRILEAQTRHAPLSVFLFDIDHFKNYNDKNGHLAGDDVLREVGRLLKQNTTRDFLLGRYGGEEFVLAMPISDEQEAFQTADRIRVAIQEHVFEFERNQPGGDLTISGGIAVFPAGGRDSQDLLKHADQALYRAKADGRNRIEAFKPTYLGSVEEEEICHESR